MNFLERKNAKEKALGAKSDKQNHVVLIGCDRTGRQLVSYFMRKKVNFLVVDFNPVVIERLTADNIEAIFGDISDPDIIDAAGLDQSSLVISTIGTSDNLSILNYINTLPSKPHSMFVSATRQEASELYKNGASFVIVPDVVAGDHIKQLLKAYGLRGDRLERAGQNHFTRMISI